MDEYNLDEVNWDPQLLGKEFYHFEQRVTREILLEYAAILGTTEALYMDPAAAQARGYRDIIALPTFVIWRGVDPVAPPAMRFTGTGINAGYDCHFSGVVYPGDTLTYTTCLVDMYEKTGRSGIMRFIVRETTVTNQQAEVIAHIRNAFILGW